MQFVIRTLVSRALDPVFDSDLDIDYFLDFSRSSKTSSTFSPVESDFFLLLDLVEGDVCLRQ